jgi:hypothetical protein
MMRYPFWLIDGKLCEADYFLEKLRTAPDLERARYLLSAFVSATRSVTFSVQKCLRGLSDFDEWYQHRHAELRSDPVARYFHKVRNELIHEGLNPLQSHERGDLTARFLLREDAPQRDVILAGEQYMALLVRIVREAYLRYWTSIDLPAEFTKDDLAARGQTIEDIEEEFDFPRGWSASETRTLEERLWWMKEFSRTEITRLIERYPS